MNIGGLPDNLSYLQFQQVSLKADNWKHTSNTHFKQMPCVKVTFWQLRWDTDYFDFVSDLHFAVAITPARCL